MGKLIYLTHTRLDISFAVSLISQFLNNPSENHMKAVYRILRYLKKDPRKGLLFKKTTNRSLGIYTDVDWGLDLLAIENPPPGIALMFGGIW